MYFCKGECKQENVLIETTGPRAQRDRYSIRNEGRSPSGQYFVAVRISQLTKSDSGLYTCGLGRTLSSASYVEFEVIVVDGEFLLKVMKMFLSCPKKSFTDSS